MLKRILTLCLAALMLAGTLALFSCQKKDEGAEQPSDTVTTLGGDATDPTMRLDVPDALDYGGQEIVVMGYDWKNSEFGNADLAQKSIVDMALFTRDNYLKNYLGINLNVLQESGQYNQVRDNSYIEPIENSIMSGAKAYDIILCYSLAAPLMATHGYMLNINAENFGTKADGTVINNHLDFSKVWWPDYMIDTVKVNDKVYFASGDASANELYMLYCVLFDSTQLENNQLDENEIYKMVDEGKWTLEAWLTMTAGLSADDGSSDWDDNDYYAITIRAEAVLDTFYFATGNRLIENKNDVLKISEDILSEKVLDIYDMVYSAIYTDHAMHVSTGVDFMKSGKCIFSVSSINNLSELVTQTSAKIGLLPFPKYDEGDEAYLSLVASPHSQFCIPIDAKDPEMSSAIIETMGYANYEMVTPVIFETVMKLRYSKDLNTSRMFDIVRAGATTELGILHYFSFFAKNGRDPSSMFRNAIGSGKTNWTSNYRNNYESGMKNTLNDLNAFYLE